MRKYKKLYGIINPNAFDYLLAIVAGMVAISALFVGIFVSVTKSFNFSNQAWQAFLGIFKFDIGTGNWITIIGCVSICLSVFFAIIITLASLFKGIYRPIIGAITILIAGVSIALMISFFGTFINPVETGVHGVFPVVLLGLTLVILFFSIFSLNLCFNRLFGEEYEDEEEYIPTQFIPDMDEEPYYDPEPVMEEEPQEESIQEKIEEEPIQEEEQQEPIQEEEEEEPQHIEEEEEVEEVKPEEIKEEIHEIEASNGKTLSINSKKLTFEQKLRRATKETRAIYREIRDYFEEIGFKLKIAKNGAIFYHKQTKYAVITVSGKNGLKVYYKLNIANYVDSPIPLIDVQNVKKYEKTPVYLKVKSDLSVKRAKHLMDDVKAGLDNNN